jgi:hypothetical protein
VERRRATENYRLLSQGGQGFLVGKSELSKRTHRLFAIAPYFATFPPAFAVASVLKHSRKGDVVFDPFAGRGTAVLAALLHGRPAIGCDLNPVAACLAGAATDPPQPGKVTRRLKALREAAAHAEREVAPDDFFALCFHPDVYANLTFLRRTLDWRGNPVDRFIAALILSVLQNDPLRTPNSLSNRLPRAIAPKKDYSVRWWRQAGLTEPPLRDVFSILQIAADLRLSDGPPPLRGSIAFADARASAKTFPDLRGRVRLVVTSPPYLDTTDFLEDCWLRRWMLGGSPDVTSGGRRNGDGRHRVEAVWWDFIEESFRGLAPLLAAKSTIVVRIGLAGRKAEDLAAQTAKVISQGLDGGVERIGLATSAIPVKVTRTLLATVVGHGKEIDLVLRVNRKTT